MNNFDSNINESHISKLADVMFTKRAVRQNTGVSDGNSTSAAALDLLEEFERNRCPESDLHRLRSLLLGPNRDTRRVVSRNEFRSIVNEWCACSPAAPNPDTHVRSANNTLKTPSSSAYHVSALDSSSSTATIISTTCSTTNSTEPPQRSPTYQSTATDTNKKWSSYASSAIANLNETIAAADKKLGGNTANLHDATSDDAFINRLHVEPFRSSSTSSHRLVSNNNARQLKFDTDLVNDAESLNHNKVFSNTAANPVTTVQYHQTVVATELPRRARNISVETQISQHGRDHETQTSLASAVAPMQSAASRCFYTPLDTNVHHAPAYAPTTNVDVTGGSPENALIFNKGGEMLRKMSQQLLIENAKLKQRLTLAEARCAKSGDEAKINNNVSTRMVEKLQKQLEAAQVELLHVKQSLKLSELEVRKGQHKADAMADALEIERRQNSDSKRLIGELSSRCNRKQRELNNANNDHGIFDGDETADPVQNGDDDEQRNRAARTVRKLMRVYRKRMHDLEEAQNKDAAVMDMLQQALQQKLLLRPTSNEAEKLASFNEDSFNEFNVESTNFHITDSGAGDAHMGTNTNSKVSYSAGIDRRKPFVPSAAPYTATTADEADINDNQQQQQKFINNTNTITIINHENYNSKSTKITATASASTSTPALNVDGVDAEISTNSVQLQEEQLGRTSIAPAKNFLSFSNTPASRITGIPSTVSDYPVNNASSMLIFGSTSEDGSTLSVTAHPSALHVPRIGLSRSLASTYQQKRQPRTTTLTAGGESLLIMPNGNYLQDGESLSTTAVPIIRQRSLAAPEKERAELRGSKSVNVNTNYLQNGLRLGNQSSLNAPSTTLNASENKTSARKMVKEARGKEYAQQPEVSRRPPTASNGSKADESDYEFATSDFNHSSPSGTKIDPLSLGAVAFH